MLSLYGIKSMFGRTFSAIMACAMILFISFGLGYNELTVLCMRSDGHVALEASFNGKCISSSGSRSHQDHRTSPENIISSHDDHCGSCTDIPLTLTLSLKNNNHHGDTVFQRYISDVKTISSQSPLVTTAFVIKAKPAHPPSADSVLRCLSTVIHLI